MRRVAEANLALLQQHPWLVDVADDRTALGPGTIAKYDHELAALAPLGLDDATWDAALTFVLDFVRASARALRPQPRAGEMAEHWPEWSPRLAAYLGEDHPLAQRVGGAAGEAMGGPGTIDAWAREGKSRARSDRVHLTREGYKQLAAAFVGDLLAAYDAWKASGGGR